MRFFDSFLGLLPLRGNYLCDNELTNRFRSIRAKIGLSQKDFAETLGVSQSAIAEIERGSREPSRNIMVALASKYHVSLDWLLLGIELNGMSSQASKDVEIENLKKEIAELENKIQQLEAENKEIAQELLERMRQLVNIQNRQLGIV
jgi:transcriptional regulator with XRE-family HTH domain